MVQGASLAQGYTHQAAPRLFRCLADRFRHLARLAVAEADAALLIADDHQCGKSEALAALHHLGDAVDMHELVFELAVAFLAIAVPVSLRTSHVDAFRSRSSNRLRAPRRPAP
jgi:hypothetical protein